MLVWPRRTEEGYIHLTGPWESMKTFRNRLPLAESDQSATLSSQGTHEYNVHRGRQLIMIGMISKWALIRPKQETTATTRVFATVIQDNLLTLVVLEVVGLHQ